MLAGLLFIYCVFLLIILYRGTAPLVFEIGSVVFFLLATLTLDMHWLPTLLMAFFIIGISALIRVPSLRLWISEKLYQRAQHTIPSLSKTEEEALNAGETWLEQDLFRGTLDWKNPRQTASELTPEEQAFLDNETQVLCEMLDESAIHHTRDLPEKVWAYMKSEGFFGLVINKEYGGKGFSARAHSDIVFKIASRCSVAAVTVMVPNSLGPGELLHYYGTTQQKNQYLPRLAKGLDIPCFALTEPNAGSDATSIQSSALVVEKKVGKQTVVGLEVTLNKRWITLAPVATLIGLAVNLKDPNKLLNGVGMEGITCLLIPRDTPDLIIGNRHLPADQPFMNGTIRGDNLFVPLDAIIGGPEKAGQGWQMLVECLAIGRSISLPALAAASSSIAYLTSGAFSRLRKQFNLEIGQFEGIEEKLAEIAGLHYLIQSTRLLTVAAVNQHKKPSVASAITKYCNTELARKVINAAMDVHAGRAVVAGPRNYMTNYYTGIPISITVEGANIMSRNLLIFGQGSMACHPYIREEFYALSRQDKTAFHDIVWQHVRYFMQNFAKTLCSTWTGGRFIRVPNNALKREYQRLTQLSHTFAWLADFALITLGGSLKRKERLSARLADGMSYLYMALAALTLYQKNAEDPSYREHAQWAVRYCFYHAQSALLAFCHNFPQRGLGMVLKGIAFPFGQTMRYPHDELDHNLAKTMNSNTGYRDAMKNSIFLSGDAKEPVDRMEHALQLLIKNKALYQKITDLKHCPQTQLKEKLTDKVAKGVLTEDEMTALITTERARWDAIQVDEFSLEALKKNQLISLIDTFPNPFD